MGSRCSRSEIHGINRYTLSLLIILSLSLFLPFLIPYLSLIHISLSFLSPIFLFQSLSLPFHIPHSLALILISSLSLSLSLCAGEPMTVHVAPRTMSLLAENLANDPRIAREKVRTERERERERREREKEN